MLGITASNTQIIKWLWNKTRIDDIIYRIKKINLKRVGDLVRGEDVRRSKRLPD